MKLTKEQIEYRNRLQSTKLEADSDILSIISDSSEDAGFDDYWAGSASQSYCNAVKSGNVRTVKVLN